MLTDAQSQIKELQARIKELRVAQLAELKEKLRQAKHTVACLEAEFANLTGEAPTAVRAIKASISRTRTSSEDIRSRILKVLAATPTGLSLREIADMAGLNYSTVMLFLKKNERSFKTTGKMRGKRYFLR